MDVEPGKISRISCSSYCWHWKLGATIPLFKSSTSDKCLENQVEKSVIHYMCWSLEEEIPCLRESKWRQFVHAGSESEADGRLRRSLGGFSRCYLRMRARQRCVGRLDIYLVTKQKEPTLTGFRPNQVPLQSN